MADLPVNFKNFLAKNHSNNFLPFNVETTIDDTCLIKSKYNEDFDNGHVEEKLENNYNQAETEELNIFNNLLNDSSNFDNCDLIEYLIRFSRESTKESADNAEINQEDPLKDFHLQKTDILSYIDETHSTNFELITEKQHSDEIPNKDNYKTKVLASSEEKSSNPEDISCFKCCLTLRRIDDNLLSGRYFNNGFIEGELVWAKISGWWPAIIINPRDIKKMSHRNRTWVFFLGEPTVANCKQVEPITSNMEQRFSTYFSKSKMPALRRRYFKATIEIIMSYMYKKRRDNIKFNDSWLNEFIIPGIHLLTRDLQKIVLYPYSTKISVPLKEIRNRIFKD